MRLVTRRLRVTTLSQDDKYSALKTDHGGFAAIVWLIVGATLFYREPEARLASWRALAFFVVGMFAAAGVLGGLSYLVTRGLSQVIPGDHTDRYSLEFEERFTALKKLIDPFI